MAAMTGRPRNVLLFLLLGSAAIGVVGLVASHRFPEADKSSPPQLSPPLSPPLSTGPRRVARDDGAKSDKADYSNILPSDYVGPNTCRECHKDKFASWSNHPHSRMNQDASPQSVKGDFSGVSISYRGGTARFDSGPDGYWMTLERGAVRRKFHVTRTVGSKFNQMYIGLQTEGPEPPEHPFYNKEHTLGFGYWFKLKRWLPTNFFDPNGPELEANGKVHFDPFDHAEFVPWASNCMPCHNTLPYLFRISVGGLTGFPGTDMLIDKPRLDAESARSIDLSMVSASADPPTVRDRLSPANLVRLGIACESCHFGGREHAVEGERIRFLPTHPMLEIKPEAPNKAESNRKNSYVVNSICAQCHCGQATYFANGAAKINAHEALDLTSGSCASRIKCTDCHNPHLMGPKEGGPDEPRYLAACLGCHEKYRDVAARNAHGRHGADSGVDCLDCHMPRIVQGLDEAVRTHHISSPTDAAMLAAGAPNACNLCHLDKSLRWTLGELERGYGKRLRPQASWSAAYPGGLDAPVGVAWLHSSDSAVRLIAAAAWGRSPLGKSHLKELSTILDDPHPNNRVYGSFAVSAALGRALSVEEYDPTAMPNVRAAQIRALVKRPVGAIHP